MTTTGFSLQKRQQTEQNQDLKLETEYTSKTKPQGNGTSDGEQDTESSRLSTKDITCTLKTKPQERSDPATSRTLS